jgi:hypothetical protein
MPFTGNSRIEFHVNGRVKRGETALSTNAAAADGFGEVGVSKRESCLPALVEPGERDSRIRSS